MTRHEPSFCPKCGHTLDASEPNDPNDTYAPEPGDVSVCFGCALILMFDPGLKLREATADEIASFEPEQRAELEDIRRRIKLLQNGLPPV